jgi:WD40 repeat protein
MAPEMFGGADGAQPEADVYALGVVAYQALTGRLPLAADSTRAYVELHRDHAPVPELGDDLPPALDRAVRRALQRHGQARTHSALALADDLKTALRTSRREQLRTSAQQWEDTRRSPGLLWDADLVDETVRTVPAEAIGPLESSFLRDSQRRIRRARSLRRVLVALAVMIPLATIAHHLVMRAVAAEELANQAEVEEGRQALLHDSLLEAQLHLTEAYQRGDRSPATLFMLARALQPLQAERARFAAAAGHMWSVAFSSDGRQVVTADDGAAQIWDAQTHERRFTLPHGDKVYDARYSADRARLVTACGDGTVRIWDAATGTLVRALKRRRADGKSSRYFIASFSPDDKLVAAIDTTGAVTHVWDAKSGAPLAELRDEAADFPAIAFSADSRWLATSGGDEARVFDTRTWTVALTVPGPRIRTLTFDPADSRLATGSASGDAAIWEIPSGARAQHLREVGAPVRAVAFSPDGKIVATGGGDGAVQFWDARSGTLRSQVDAIHGKVLSIEFDSTSERVVAAGDGGAAVVAETIGVPVVVLDAPPAVVRAAHFDPTSHQVVSADWDGAAYMWDATPLYRRWGAPPVADSCGLAVSLEPDRRFLAVGCRDRPTRIWDTAHDQLLAELPSVTTVAGDFASAFPAVSAVGDRAAIARGDAVEVYELPSGRLARVIKHPAAVDTVAFASAGHDLVSGAIDGSLLVTRDGHDPIVLPTSPGGVDAVGFLPDGRVVATDVRRRIRIYDADRGAVVADLDLPTRVRLLRPSPDGTRLVTVPNMNGEAAPSVLWDLERYQRVAALDDRGAETAAVGRRVGQVSSARFADGSREILTVADDGMARLWDGRTGRLLSSYRSTSRFLADAVLAPDGSTIVAGGSDGALWFWDRAIPRPLWKLRAHDSHVVGVHFEGDALVTRGFGGEVARWTLPDPERVIEAALPDR